VAAILTESSRLRIPGIGSEPRSWSVSGRCWVGGIMSTALQSALAWWRFPAPQPNPESGARYNFERGRPHRVAVARASRP
jgi:hypothetical protein